MSDPAGWSVFAVDPGDTSGWAWACVGRSELLRFGAEGALQSCARHRSGVQAADRRFLFGQVATQGRFRNAAELDHVDELINLMMVCGKMASRTSGGRVQGITDLTVEDFVLRERTKDRNLLSPVRLTAMLRYGVHVRSLTPERITSFSSSDAMNVVTDERLKRWGFWHVGQQHARDATRHLILHLRKLEEELRS